jgi:hypothetical protein
MQTHLRAMEKFAAVHEEIMHAALGSGQKG